MHKEARNLLLLQSVECLEVDVIAHVATRILGDRDTDAGATQSVAERVDRLRRAGISDAICRGACRLQPVSGYDPARRCRFERVLSGRRCPGPSIGRGYVRIARAGDHARCARTRTSVRRAACA